MTDNAAYIGETSGGYKVYLMPNEKRCTEEDKAEWLMELAGIMNS
jgi:hypothetical protein